MHVPITMQLSDKFNIIIVIVIAIFRILRRGFHLVGAITSKVFLVSCSNVLYICYPVIRQVQ